MVNRAEPFALRLPPDIKRWIVEQAERYGGSQNAEIIRAVREKMERTKATTGESLQAHPAAADHDTAPQGGPVTHGL